MTTESRQPLLACHGLTVGYKNKAIVEDINVSIETGQFIGMLGPNGAGKTTLLRTLSRHLTPLSGEVRLQGRKLKDFRQGELARVMAIVLTDKISPPLFSVFDFVALGRYPHTDFLGRLTAEDQQVISRALHAVRAEQLVHRDFSSLSDGERQKVLVARALAQEPKILLLDEPTAHLDLKHRIEVMDILRNLCRDSDLTVIASLHDVDIAAKVSDQVALVKDGRLSHFGYPEEVLAGDAVSHLYDFQLARFDQRLGSIEMGSDSRRQEQVFVIAGMGSGTMLYRLLAKRGYDVATGILYSNDIDCYVAVSLGATCLSQPLNEEAEEKTMAKALAAMGASSTVIYTAGDAGTDYAANQLLLQKARIMDKPILRLQQQSTGADETQYRFSSASELLDFLENDRRNSACAVAM